MAGRESILPWQYSGGHLPGEIVRTIHSTQHALTVSAHAMAATIKKEEASID